MAPDWVSSFVPRFLFPIQDDLTVCIASVIQDKISRWAGERSQRTLESAVLGEVRVETEGEFFFQRVVEGQGVRSPSSDIIRSGEESGCHVGFAFDALRGDTVPGAGHWHC